jgi:hypothetical protein
VLHIATENLCPCLQRCLLLLPGQTKDSVHTLLNPEDPQDVPRAILLLEAVVALRVRRIEFQVSALDVNTNSDLDCQQILLAPKMFSRGCYTL